METPARLDESLFCTHPQAAENFEEMSSSQWSGVDTSTTSTSSITELSVPSSQMPGRLTHQVVLISSPATNDKILNSRSSVTCVTPGSRVWFGDWISDCVESRRDRGRHEMRQRVARSLRHAASIEPGVWGRESHTAQKGQLVVQ